MATGTVKWFNSDKGIGFTQLDNGGEDAIVHSSAIFIDGKKELTEGQRVTFDVMRGAKGVSEICCSGIS